MVKGVSRRVVVIRSPESNLFEQAIFIMKDCQGKIVGASEDIVEEACKVANGYLRNGKDVGKLGVFTKVLYAAAGASLMAVIWIISAII